MELLFTEKLIWPGPFHRLDPLLNLIWPLHGLTGLTSFYGFTWFGIS